MIGARRFREDNKLSNESQNIRIPTYANEKGMITYVLLVFIVVLVFGFGAFIFWYDRLERIRGLDHKEDDNEQVEMVDMRDFIRTEWGDPNKNETSYVDFKAKKQHGGDERDRLAGRSRSDSGSEDNTTAKNAKRRAKRSKDVTKYK